MKANVENLLKAMQLCAEAHHAEFKDWSEDEQIGIKSEDVPVVMDVRMIAEAFYGKKFVDVEAKWNYTTLWMQDKFLRSVNMDVLALALPQEYLKRMF